MIRNDKKLKQGYLLGPYRIVRLIGEGGMGEVYEARDEVLNRQVALKVISPKLASNDEIVRRFMSEGQALARLNHQNVVGVYSLGEERGTHYIVMEYVDGYSLHDFLKLKNSLTVDEALHHFKQLLEGVKALHENGIIHRDIKPKNIIIRKDNSVKIVDFGIAKIQGETKSGLTGTGELVGSLYYVAPEVIEGGEATVQSDIWSLGINLYGMLTGKNPFEATKRSAVIDKITKEDLVFPKDNKIRIPDPLKRIILKMCEKNPARRYTSVNDILLDVQGLKKGGMIPVPPTPEMGLVIGREEVVPQSVFVGNFKTGSLNRIRSQPRSRQYGALLGALILFAGAGWYAWTRISESSFFTESKTDMAAVPNVPTDLPPVSGPGTSSAPVSLITPVNGQKIWLADQEAVHFEFNGGSDADLYLEVAKDRAFHKIVFEEAHPVSPYFTRLVREEGVYFWRLARRAAGQSIALTEPYNFTLVSQEGPHLIYPVSQIVYPDSQPIKFYWQEKRGAQQYRFQLASDISFTHLFSDQLVMNTQTLPVEPPPGDYYWRVRAEDNPMSTSQWSETRSVRVQMVLANGSKKSRHKLDRGMASIPPSNEKPVAKSKKSPVAPAPKKVVRLQFENPPAKPSKKSGFSYRTGSIHADQSNVQKGALSEIPALKTPTSVPPATAPTAATATAKPVTRKVASVPSKSLEIPTPKTKLPPNGASIVSLSGSSEPISFRWESIGMADSYRLEISANPKFSHVLYSLIVKENQLVLNKKVPRGKIYWRVRAEKGADKSEWSTPFSFEILK